MFTREKIFTVYEKPEAAEPSEQVLLLREGFCVWALLFHGFWLIVQRMWLVLALYVAAALVLSLGADMLHLSDLSSGVLQFGLQLLLAYHAYDLKGWGLRRRGYHLAGVLAADSAMRAEQRYYECAV